MNAPAKYRKKPVVVEAMRYDGHNFSAFSLWAGAAIGEKFTGGLTIPTREGEMTADVGDWIIKGVQGELYPCKPEIFDATYETNVIERAALSPLIPSDSPKETE